MTTTQVRGQAATEAPPPAHRPRKPLLRRVFGASPMGTLFAVPYAVFLAVVFAYPLGFAIWMSFHDYFFAAPGAVVDRPFVGLENYRTVLTDPDVRQAFGNVGIFLIINVPLTVVLAMVLATALNSVRHFQTFLRVSYYVPYVTASVAVVGVWLFLFARTGFINTVLGPLAPEPSWLVNERLAMPIIAVFVAWKQLGFFVLLYLAALQNVAKELYEAAALDGAGTVRRFWSITVPSVRPATTLVAILALITGANLFTEPYLLTGGGGPNGASTSPVLLMYQRGLEQGRPDVASAIGVILVLLVLLVALLQRRLIESR